MKKAIVTGGAGFIGSHMAELLLSNGYHVLAIDDMSNGQKDNVDIFLKNPSYRFLKLDVSQDFDDSIFRGVDYVFHMAALADIIPSMKEPARYHNANVTGTIKILEACRKHRVKKAVYTASSSCYGIPDEYPTPETAEIRPQYPYAFTKYVGELYAMFWHRLYGLPVVSLRFFNVYGTRARTNDTYGAVFKVFLAQKLNGLPLTIIGDGTQTRDFTYVTDAARAALMAAESRVAGEIINIGTGKPQSVNYLARLIGGPTVHIPKRPGEPESTHADIAKARKLLKWEPQVPFEEGVKIMLDNISYWKKAPVWTEEKIEKATEDWFKYLGKKNANVKNHQSDILTSFVGLDRVQTTGGMLIKNSYQVVFDHAQNSTIPPTKGEWNSDIKKVLITGGAGYVGSALVPRLLEKGYEVVVYDIYIYGDVFKDIKNKKLTQTKADIRDKAKLVAAAKGCDAIIHLACISNDPSFELDPELGKSINYDAFFNVIEAARANKAKRLIYASSSSVYGLKSEKNVREEAKLEPLTDYSKFKADCERLLHERKDIEWAIIRPATVCGYAPRLRLDVVVNILAINALVNRKIKILGGEQLRPNLNIRDMVRAYELLLEAPWEKIRHETFNAGYQNLKVAEIAKIVRKLCGKDIQMEVVPSNDNRSYHINSDKIKRVLGFAPKFTVEEAVQSLVDAFNKGLIKNGMNNPIYYNIKRMQELKLT